MGFKAATDYMRTYREERGKALNNEQRMGWFCDNASDMTDLLDKFSSTEENSTWEDLYEKNTAPTRRFEAERIKIAFLAGCRRDLRMLFASGENNRIRLPLDHDRYEYMRTIFHRLKMDVLKQVVESKAEKTSG